MKIQFADKEIQVCHMHDLNLDAPESPTDEDRKRVNEITLQSFKETNKHNEITLAGMFCPKCGVTYPFANPDVKPKVEVQQ